MTRPRSPWTGPTGVLALCTLVDACGTGLWLTTSMVFLTRSAGLTATRVGLGLSVAGVVGFAAGLPLGQLADRRGARDVAVALAVVEGVMMAAFTAVHGLVSFMLVASLFQGAERGGSAVRNALVVTSVPPAERVRVRAVMRAVMNGGVSAGALLAGVVLAVDTRSAYLAVILANAGSFLVAAALLLRIPRVRPVPRPAGDRSSALRDRPFVAVTLLSGLLAFHGTLLSVAVPLWVLRHTSAPRALIAVLMLVNTVLAVSFQVPLSRGAESVAGAGRLLCRAGLVLASCCLLFPVASLASAGLASAILITGIGVLTLGEIWQSAGGWGLSYELAPSHAVGAYQGVYALGMSLREMVGPGLVTALAVGWGWPGWLVLGAAFAGLGLLAPAVVRWSGAARRKEVGEALHRG